MKARAEAELGRKGLDRPRAQARPRRHPRHRVRGAAAPARPRPPRRVDPLAHHARRARRSSRRGGYVERARRGRLADAYVFLRTVEHRLQLSTSSRPTRSRPTEPRSRASRASSATATRRAPTALERSTPSTARTRRPCARSTSGCSSRRCSTRSPAPGRCRVEAAEERLAAFGFVDAAHTRAALRELTQRAHPHARAYAAAAARHPRLAVGDARSRPRAAPAAPARRGPDALAPRSAPTFRDTPGAAERVCRILGSSRVLGDALLRQPDFVELLGDDDCARRAQRSPTSSSTRRSRRCSGAPTSTQRRAGLRRFKRRELLRIARTRRARARARSR